jgi:hypothetical protein
MAFTSAYYRFCFQFNVRIYDAISYLVESIILLNLHSSFGVYSTYEHKRESHFSSKHKTFAYRSEIKQQKRKRPTILVEKEITYQNS